MDPAPLVQPDGEPAAPTRSRDMATFFVPLQLSWNGYKPQELAQRSRIRCLDALVVPIFAFWYVAMARLVTTDISLASATALAATQPPSTLVSGTRIALALLAVYVLAVHSVAFPSPTEDNETYVAMSKLGRWIFLTRHGVCLQAWHQVLSLASLWYPSLIVPTHGICIWIASLGWFVTIQYFVLVAPNEQFQKDCVMWKKDRGVQFKEVGFLLHALALPIAVADMALVRNASVLQATVSLPSSFAVVFAYVFLYLTLITINYGLVGVWPYGFMKEFGTNLKKWVVFVFGQCLVISVFFGANVLIYLLKTSQL